MSKSPFVQIPEEAFSAFKKLIEFGPSRIATLLEALRQTGPTLEPAGLRAFSASEKMGDKNLSDDIEAILRDVVFPIRRTMHRNGLSAREMVSGLSAAIEQISSSESQEDGFSKAEALKWAECEDAISELFDSETMKIEGKAEALIDARGNRIFEINLYSDLRPLFDDEAENIQANLLTNTLVLRFNGGGRPRTETFALDPASLKELRVQVDRALRKNALLARGESQSVRVLVVRSDSEGSGDRQ
jgi:hypothetical protein